MERLCLESSTVSMFRNNNLLLIKESIPLTLIITLLKVMTVSSEISLVCPGDQLVLTCGFNGTGVQWDVTYPNMSTGVGIQFISESGRDVLDPIVANGVVYRFSRTSISPLVSVLQIDNVNANINGTRIECYNNYRNEMLLTTVINVVENGEFRRLTIFLAVFIVNYLT